MSHHLTIPRPRGGVERLTPARLPVTPTANHTLALDGPDRPADRTSLGHRLGRPSAGRMLATILFTDIVDSTQTVVRLGDHRWRELLSDHYADCRAEVARGGGEVAATTGDGILALFGAPSTAFRVGMAIQAAGRRRGLRVRAGVHAGECERSADGVAGIAVHIAARICALAAAEEVLTTNTVRELLLGSDFAFEPRGVRELKGVPDQWTVFTVGDHV
jgi:class 3 adenylate cyclase